ncbi:High mobility group box domain [Arabidopsis suecica]|uniref:High mobility group box domain n=1 Tax=Arabidopsis suecica TaxID=45249 RepID=A0A8T1ZAZ4_ARASU|nr:High mobility group box domain [Arabidopsis suecica]
MAADASSKVGSFFIRCEDCNKKIPEDLISMHTCYARYGFAVYQAAQAVDAESQATRRRKAKDSNRPPLTGFVIFMNGFRKSFRTDYNGSLVKEVSKIGWEMWKSMTEDEKKVYVDKAAELMANDEEEVYLDEESDDTDEAEDKEVS